MKARKSIPVVAVAVRSGSGKTTLKDTCRFREAGDSTVISAFGEKGVSRWP